MGEHCEPAQFGPSHIIIAMWLKLLLDGFISFFVALYHISEYGTMLEKCVAAVSSHSKF